MQTLFRIKCVFLKCKVEFYNLVFLHVETAQPTSKKPTFQHLSQQKYGGFLLIFCITRLENLRPTSLKECS